MITVPKDIQQIIDRFQETDISVGTRFYKLEVTEDEKVKIIKILTEYPKIIQCIEDFQTTCETEVKQDLQGKIRYNALVGLLQRIKTGSLNLR